MTWQPGITLIEMEKLIILRALVHYGQNKAKTAKALGISINTLKNKLEIYEAQSAKPLAKSPLEAGTPVKHEASNKAE